MHANATVFGRDASGYAAARPDYPDALFDWIAAEAPQRGLALDVGTGSGQAARSLASRFACVVATDLDPAQVAAATGPANVAFRIAPAHASGLEDASADAVTVATALHWFDLAAFWVEVRRVLRPGGLFCAWTYVWQETDEATERHLVRPVMDLVDPYWSDGNRLCERGYPAAEVGFPFTPLTPPRFACALSWTPTRIAAFLRSWSAHALARADGLAETLEDVEREALVALGPAPRPFRLPLALLAGRA